MKNRLLPLFLVLGAYSAYSQVGVGKLDPNPSSQLEVFAEDRGILIPRVKLKNSTDKTTVINGSTGYENSLMVFNTELIADIKPGYYYWYVDRWKRLAVSDEISGNGTVTYNPITKEFTYIDNSGNPQVINISNLVKETITEVKNNGDGTYTYTNENKDAVTINVVGDVTSNFSTIANTTQVKQIIENIVKHTGGNVSYDGTTKEFTYVDQNGVTKVINISDLIKETITEVKNNGDGTYTYTNEKGDAVTINVVGDVTTNFSAIAGNTEVKKIIEKIVKNTGGNVSYDGTAKQFSYIDETGAVKVIDISSLVKNNETVTTLTDNNNGTYTYTNEKGDAVTINVVGDVTTNFSAIAGNTEVKKIIEKIVKNTGGNVSYDGTAKQFSYIDETGAVKVIDISSLVKNNETVTTLTDNNNGTYTYTNEKGDAVTINVVGDVTTNFSAIAGNTEVKKIIEKIVKNTGGNVSYDGTAKQFSYIDETGAVKVIDISSLVKNNETVTTLSDNNNGTYTYTNEKGDAVTINVVGDVTTNFSAIAGNTEVKKIIEKIVKNTGGNVSYDGTAKQFSYIDETGAVKVIDISSLVKNNETVTTLSDNNNGTYTYTNEKGDAVTINVVGDVTTNFSAIAGNTEVKKIIEKIVKNTGGNVSYDGTAKQFSYIDETGAVKVIDISSLVKNNETVTTLSDNNNGTYTYTNEKGDAVTINVVGDVTTNFSAIAGNTEVKKIIEKIVKNTGGNVSYDGTAKQFSYIDETGAVKVIDISSLVKNNETVTTLSDNNNGTYTYTNEKGDAVTINVVGDVTTNFSAIAGNTEVKKIIEKIVKNTGGNVSYDGTAKQFSYIDETGAVKVIDISSLVKNNETVTTLTDNNNGTYTYTNEKGDAVTINVVGDVTTNFSAIAGNTEVKKIIEKIVKNTGGNVSYDGTAKQFSYIDETGAVKVIDISSLVKNNETVTTLSDNNNGTYTYTNEKGDAVTINVVGDVTTNFSAIAGNTEVKKIIEKIVKNTGGNVSYDGTAKQFSYIDETGAVKVIDISSLVKNNETVTTLSDNNNGTYTYTNEKGDAVTINVVGDVTTNFSAIAGNTEVKKIIEKIVKNTGGNVSYDGTAKQFSYIDETGAVKVIDISSLVKNNETVTTLSDNNNGTYTYTNEKGDAVTINVVGDVTTNFSAIAGNTEVKKIIEKIVKNTGGNVSYDGTAKQFSYIDETGAVKVIDISSLVKNNETVTTLSDNNNGTYTYTNEKGDAVTINVVGDVTTNFSAIAGNTEVKKIIEKIVKNTGGNVSYDGTAKQFSYIDETGAVKVIDISNLVKQNETLTSLTFDATTKKLTYKDEAQTSNLVDLSSIAAQQQIIDELPVESAGQTDFTLTATPSSLSTVKMYRNGVRLSKSAFTVTGTAVKYIPSGNNSDALQLIDTITFDYLK